MLRFLRTTSIARLLAFVVGAVCAAGATAAIALAATSQSGSKPAPKPLAQAVHDALTAPSVPGVSARIKFTNHLIDSAAIPGVGPLLSGASGRLWASPDGRLRLELQSTTGDSQVVFDRGRVLVYDAQSNTAYRAQLPRHPDKQRHNNGAPSLAQVKTAIGQARQHWGISAATPTTAAGQSAYSVRVTPLGGGQVSGAQLVWDAVRGVPLKVAVYARGNGSPVLALSVEKISYGSVPASVFNLSPPKGSQVVDITPPPDKQSPSTKLSFKVNAPAQLAGKTRREVKRLGGDAALVTYGEGLDGLAVIERKADNGQSATLGGHSLPSVSINGTTGQELPTALGTVVRFTRDGVEYTVLGSQPTDTVLAAARAL
jgi:outer membrane lipoprotein-sorting protein